MKNSERKEEQKGKDILAKVNNKKNVVNKGNEYDNPWKYTKNLEWYLLYNNPINKNNPLDINAWVNINNDEPIKPIKSLENNPNIEKFICIIEEYAIIFLKSNNALIDNIDA